MKFGHKDCNNKTMRTLIISDEYSLKNMNQFLNGYKETELTFFSESKDPFVIISKTIDLNPALIVIDDDFTSPNTVQILKSIKTINKKIATIFVTSNSSLELGREVTPLGVQFYAIKPLSVTEIFDSIKSIINLQRKMSY